MFSKKHAMQQNVNLCDVAVDSNYHNVNILPEEDQNRDKNPKIIEHFSLPMWVTLKVSLKTILQNKS